MKIQRQQETFAYRIATTTDDIMDLLGPWPERKPSPPPEVDEPKESEEQFLRRVYEDSPPRQPGIPSSPGDLTPHLMLPTDVVDHYREFDRPYDEQSQMLERVIRDQGIRQPLQISTDGTHAMLIEGNHRLQVAKRLGLKELPVTVWMEKPGDVMGQKDPDMIAAHPDYHNPAPLEPVLSDWIGKNRHHLKSFWE